MKNIIVLCFVLILFSCNNYLPSNDKIVGVWKSNNGAIVEFKEDKSVKVINYPFDFINGENKEIINGKGTWKIYKDDSLNFWVVEISLNSDKMISNLQSNGVVLDLLIAQNGFLGNGKDIMSLFFWIGDPDSDNRYEFKRK